MDFLKALTLGITFASNYLVSYSRAFSRCSCASLVALFLLFMYSGFLSLEFRVYSIILFSSLLFSEEMLATFPLYWTSSTCF